MTYQVLALIIAVLAGIIMPIVLDIRRSLAQSRREASEREQKLAATLQSIQDQMRSHETLDERLFSEHGRRLDDHEMRIRSIEGKRVHYAKAEVKDDPA